ncbi:MAG: BolA family protein [Gammaproteobacteria bacterium]
MQRIEIIRQRLQHAFAPEQLEILDDSEQHKGHAGSRGGAGHYTVIIAADCFNNLSRVDSHRKIYAVLQDLIPHEIHALKINIVKKL